MEEAERGADRILLGQAERARTRWLVPCHRYVQLRARINTGLIYPRTQRIYVFVHAGHGTYKRATVNEWVLWNVCRRRCYYGLFVKIQRSLSSFGGRFSGSGHWTGGAFHPIWQKRAPHCTTLHCTGGREGRRHDDGWMDGMGGRVHSSRPLTDGHGQRTARKEVQQAGRQAKAARPNLSLFSFFPLAFSPWKNP